MLSNDGTDHTRNAVHSWKESLFGGDLSEITIFGYHDITECCFDQETMATCFVF